MWTVHRTIVFGAAAVVGITLNACMNYYFDKYWHFLRKKLKCDVLKINKLFTFGVFDTQCCPNKDNEAECFNFDCNHGKINYVLELLKNANKSVDVCIYIITAELIGNAILDAHKRGLNVRVIADSDMAYSSQSSVHTLRANNVAVRHRPSPFIMHHKFILIDDEILVTGSLNFTMTGIYCNWETVILTSQPQIVEPFCGMFSNLWEEFDMVKVTPYTPHEKEISISDEMKKQLHTRKKK